VQDCIQGVGKTYALCIFAAEAAAAQGVGACAIACAGHEFPACFPECAAVFGAIKEAQEAACDVVLDVGLLGCGALAVQCMAE
jgi:hypothetical protein